MNIFLYLCTLISLTLACWHKFMSSFHLLAHTVTCLVPGFSWRLDGPLLPCHILCIICAENDFKSLFIIENWHLVLLKFPSPRTEAWTGLAPVLSLPVRLLNYPITMLYITELFDSVPVIYIAIWFYLLMTAWFFIIFFYFMSAYRRCSQELEEVHEVKGKGIIRLAPVL